MSPKKHSKRIVFFALSSENTVNVTFLLSSAALLFSRLKAQLALSATCFRGIASFDRMAGIKKEFEASCAESTVQAYAFVRVVQPFNMIDENGSWA